MQARLVPLVAMGLSVFVAAPLLGQDAAGDKSSATSTTTTGAAAGVAFPDLSGPYKVGRTSYALMDSSRKEVFTSEPDDARELVITVHYPAEAPIGASPAPYADTALVASIAEAYHVPWVLIEAMHSHAFDKPAAVAKPGGFPVVIFSPGFKSHPLFYTAIIEGLASHGFVVVSVCHTYSTGVIVFPDGRVLRANDEGQRFEVDKKKPGVSGETIVKERDAMGEVWLADVRFVLDSLARLADHDGLLAGQLDLAHVGIFGHSFGGATAAAAVERDPRFRAGINLDGSDLSGTKGESIADRFLWLASEMKLPAQAPRPRLIRS